DGTRGAREAPRSCAAFGAVAKSPEQVATQAALGDAFAFGKGHMVRRLIDWAVANPVIVIILTLGLVAFGGYAFFNVNIEAYPDPAPAIIEVVAQYPGASAEEVERQVTIPLEVALAGMPGLEITRSKSLFGLSHIRNQFNYSRDYEQAK